MKRKTNNADVIKSALIAAAILGSKQKEEKVEEIEDKTRKTAEDVGNTYYHIYLGYKDAGFTDEQAFKLLLATIGRN